MKLGRFNFIVLLLALTTQTYFASAEDKIETVPLINLDDLLPTFEEDKIELESIDEKEGSLKKDLEDQNNKPLVKTDKVYVNVTALDKITAKTSLIKLSVGEKKKFGSLEIKALKCELSEGKDILDTVAYLQVKDLSTKDNNQVFIFNGWTFASSPTLKSIDHPVYDLWITSCENI